MFAEADSGAGSSFYFPAKILSTNELQVISIYFACDIGVTVMSVYPCLSLRLLWDYVKCFCSVFATASV